MSATRGPDAWPLGGGAARGRPRGMGRGLAAIMAVETDQGAGTEEFRQVPVGSIHPNPRQPRRHFDDDALSALAASMEARGVLQPVLVRPVDGDRFELIAGERRWRAARIAGLATIPAVVRAHGDAESLELALIENMAREDLNPVEEARACAALVEELSLSREEVGVRIGRSRVAVSNLVRLLDLPDEALDLLERGLLSEGHGRALLTANDHASRRRLARSAADEGWSVRTLEQRARDANEGDAAEEERSRPAPARAAPRPDRGMRGDQRGACRGPRRRCSRRGRARRRLSGGDDLRDARRGARARAAPAGPRRRGVAGERTARHGLRPPLGRVRSTVDLLAGGPAASKLRPAGHSARRRSARPPLRKRISRTGRRPAQYRRRRATDRQDQGGPGLTSCARLCHPIFDTIYMTHLENRGIGCPWLRGGEPPPC